MEATRMTAKRPQWVLALLHELGRRGDFAPLPDRQAYRLSAWQFRQWRDEARAGLPPHEQRAIREIGRLLQAGRRAAT